MKKRGKLIPEKAATSYILGYTCGNDLSSGDLFQADSQQTLRAHGFDTATSVGPFIETDVLPGRLNVALSINGKVVIKGTTADMIYSVEMIVSYITQFMTLNPGDIVFMGTPMTAPVFDGDVVGVHIESIGDLQNQVVAQQ